MDGILNINKPKGLTSHQVVLAIRKLLNLKKVGHSGTLDPQAEGVLLILLGSATKLSSYLTKLSKEYLAEMSLGIKTDTLDTAGKIIEIKEVKNIDEEKIKNVFLKFQGEVWQRPPLYSAVHYQGKRLYKLARAGILVEPKVRQIKIYKLELLNFQKNEHPKITFKVICSSGTYIRSLGADIGDNLGCGAHLSNLVRTRIGNFKLEDSITIEELKEIKEKNKIEQILLTFSNKESILEENETNIST